MSWCKIQTSPNLRGENINSETSRCKIKILKFHGVNFKHSNFKGVICNLLKKEKEKRKENE